MRAREETFLGRWSRLKQDAAAKPAAIAKTDAAPAAAALPPLESLSFESDFGAFMAARVDEGIRRAALRKLFSDPRFNVMDGLDVYIDDYSKEDPIAPAMLAELQHARTTLFGAPVEEKEKTPAETPVDETRQTPDGASP
jgi:hypothetical protein